MTIDTDTRPVEPAWLSASDGIDGRGRTWVDELRDLWEEYQSLTIEAEELRARLAVVEAQLEGRAGALEKAQELHDVLRRIGRDKRLAGPVEAEQAAPLHPFVVTAQGVTTAPPAPAASPAPSAGPTPLEDASAATPPVLDGPTGVPVAHDPAAPPADGGPRRRRFPLGRVGRIAACSIAGLGLMGMLFLSVGPRFLPYQAMVVRSGSMSPTIPTGSVVLYHRAGATQIKVGDVIVFAKPGDPTEKVTHRVYKIGEGANGRYFETKGDANGSPDAWRISAAGTGWVAFSHLPEIGYVLGYLQTSAARMMLIVIPALLLGAMTLIEIWRPGRGALEPTAA